MPVQRFQIAAKARPTSATGLWVALILLSFWGASLYVLLRGPSVSTHFIQGTEGDRLWACLVAGLGLGLRTLLHTGLFITAHDAMHGLICPQQPRWNHRLGQVALLFYALLPYHACRRSHLQHHRQPACAADPDFHDGQHTGFWAWYLRFMTRYLQGSQLWVQGLGMAVIFIGLAIAQVPLLNLLLFWILPLILSSLQLFYFGIYLPHREPAEGYGDRHHAQSSRWPWLWSFLSCYHFGYHWEHHEYPQVPWYHLPQVARNQ